jgi:ATP-dependent exoDNAse (exonuclease V) beta subunit
MSNLSIYKASAGSGKTYQLTWIYLKMLFSDPSSYRQILAVTFTNKAAGEMKSRILESLWLLGKGDSVVSGYQQDLQKLFSLNSDEVKVKAHSILIRILNDYSSFFVGTIDRFFQWVIRGFVREIGLQTGYNLELNNDKILHEAVDLLMFKMDEDEELKDWLFMFAGDRIIEGKSWNLQKEIFNLGKEIFREGYQLLAAVVPASADLRKEVNIYKKELQESISRYENTLKSMSNKALQIISAEGLAIEDFSNKYSGPAGHFVKVASNTGIKLDPGKRAIDAAENIDAWAAKSCANRSQVIHVAGSLQPILRDVINYQLDHEKEYFAARCLLRNIYVFGILNDISLQIKEIAHDKNIFLLSDASVFLKKIIEDNEAPFIYEKAGN